nr:MAG: hypothetical protein [Wufeng shrew picorna-like virus 22]
MSTSGDDGSGSIPASSPVSLVLEAVQRRHGRHAARHYPISEEYRECGDPDRWRCNLSTPTIKSFGVGATKRAAKHEAYKDLLLDLNRDLDLLNITPSCSCVPQRRELSGLPQESSFINPIFFEDNYADYTKEFRLSPTIRDPRGFDPSNRLAKSYMLACISEQMAIADKISKHFNRAVDVYLLNSPPQDAIYCQVSIGDESYKYQEDSSVSPSRFLVLSKTSQSDCWDPIERVAIMQMYVLWPHTFVSKDGCKITLADDKANQESSDF